jgi:hypothetical protein
MTAKNVAIVSIAILGTLVSFAERTASAQSQLGSCWAEVEYLHWWTKGNDLPALVTTSPPGTDKDEAGVLGEIGTEVLFGAEAVDRRDRSGMRITLGHWLDKDQQVGAEVTWFSVFDDAQSGDFHAASSGIPTLARPFFNVASGTNAAELTAYVTPNGITIVEGGIDITSTSEMHSGSVSLRHLLTGSPAAQIHVLGGYRFFRYREGILIEEQVIVKDPGGLVQIDTTFDLADHFVAENDFHGGELGVGAEFTHQLLTLELLAKVALGGIFQDVSVTGQTTVTDPPPSNAVDVREGGLLALPTNIGNRSNREFAVLPEFAANLKLDLTEQLTFTVGYTLILLNHVARSGEQIDTGLNLSQLSLGGLSGAPRPTPLLNDSDFWAQGINLGIVWTH